MENTIHNAEGVPVMHQWDGIPGAAHPLQSCPEKQNDGRASNPKCTGMVPSFRTQFRLWPSSRRQIRKYYTEHIRRDFISVLNFVYRCHASRFSDLQELEPGGFLVIDYLSVRRPGTDCSDRLLLVELEAMEQQLAARVERPT